LGETVPLDDVLAAYRRGHLDSKRFEEDLRRAVCERLMRENRRKTDAVMAKLHALEPGSLAGRAEWWRLQDECDRLMAESRRLADAAYGATNAR
jgi:hypothetical protein